MAALDTATGAKVRAYVIAGPASYATGGFLVDGSADFTSIGFIDIQVVTRGVLPVVDYEIDLNVNLAGAAALGQGVVKVVRGRYNKATIGAVTGQPAGVTVQPAKTATATVTGSSHTHPIDHNHAAVTSLAQASQVLTNAAPGVATIHSDHVHSFDPPAFTGTSGASTHTHERGFEYEHIHALTTSTIDSAPVEIAAATDLSGVSFAVLVYGFGKQ